MHHIGFHGLASVIVMRSDRSPAVCIKETVKKRNTWISKRSCGWLLGASPTSWFLSRHLWGGYVVESFSHFYFSEKKLIRKSLHYLLWSYMRCVLPPHSSSQQEGPGFPGGEGVCMFSPRLCGFSPGEAGAPDFLRMLRFPLQSKTCILGLMSSRYPVAIEDDHNSVVDIVRTDGWRRCLNNHRLQSILICYCCTEA